MIRTVYEAGTTCTGTDLYEGCDKALARRAIEQHGKGYLVTAHETPNLPGRLPAVVRQTTALETYENGAWRTAAVH